MSDLFSYLWPLVAVALSTSTAAAFLNKIVNTKNSLLKWLISNTIIVAPVLLHALLSSQSTNKYVVLAQTTIVGFIATPFYLGALKPLFAKVDIYNGKKEADKAKIAAYDEQMRSALEPAPTE